MNSRASAYVLAVGKKERNVLRIAGEIVKI